VRKVEFIEAIPKTASGKLLRRQLVEHDRAQAKAAANKHDRA
jgi:acyl-coenzyme A synthetase/AMP-(fatty) acid ligase